MTETSADAEAPDTDGQLHRSQAIAANNATWDILDKQTYTADAGDELLNTAHAASFHWARAVDSTPANSARASWMLSRCYVVLGHGKIALHHADQCASVCAAANLADFDLAYAHEARARALACLGDLEGARSERQTASDIEITDPEDRSIFVTDLEAEPWFGLATDRTPGA